MWALRRQGWSGEAIARQLGMGRTTVYRYLHTPTFPERKGRADRGQSVLNPYKDYLVQRWNAGCRDTRQLCAELRPRGYRGSYPTVARYTQRLRQAQGAAPRQRLMGKRCWRSVNPRRRCSRPAGRRGWCCDVRTSARRSSLSSSPSCAPSRANWRMPSPSRRLCPAHPPAPRGTAHPWLERAAQSTLGVFRRFAQGLRDDDAAVKAGMTLPWSTGPVEGHINRLTMLKRQMFGRARLDLLSRRFLLAPRRARSPSHARRHRRRRTQLLPSDVYHDGGDEG